MGNEINHFVVDWDWGQFSVRWWTCHWPDLFSLLLSHGNITLRCNGTNHISRAPASPTAAAAAAAAAAARAVVKMQQIKRTWIIDNPCQVIGHAALAVWQFIALETWWVHYLNWFSLNICQSLGQMQQQSQVVIICTHSMPQMLHVICQLCFWQRNCFQNSVFITKSVDGGPLTLLVLFINLHIINIDP